MKREALGIRVEPVAGAVSAARLRILAAIDSWGVPLSNESLSDLALMCMEAITDALDRAGAACDVTVRWTGRRVRVELTRGSPEAPVSSAAGPGQTRGLFLVDALSTDWGSFTGATGQGMWFEVCPSTVHSGDTRLTAMVRAANSLFGIAKAPGTDTQPVSRPAGHRWPSRNGSRQRRKPWQQ